MKIFLKYVLLYILLTTLMLGALFLVSFIPKDLIRQNTKKTATIMNYEGEKIYFNSFGRKLYDDNSTDAIMINLTYTIDEENKLESIIKNRRNYIPGVTKEVQADKVGNLPYEKQGSSKINQFSMTKELLKTVRGIEQTSFEYGRYWHGYIVVLRILLCLFDISIIRAITQITILFLLILLMYYLGKNCGFRFSIALFFAFIATDCFTGSYMLQGKYVTIIALLVSIFIAKKKINSKNLNVWLFISGALTAYFDFLTTPLLSLLLPIVIYTAIYKDNNSFKKEIIKMIKCFIAWGIGYLGLWATKWIISDLLYGTDIIKVSFTQIYYRVFGINNDDKIEIKNIEALGKNIIVAINYLMITMYALSFVWAIIKKIYYRKKGMFVSANKLPYYVCIIATLAWYFIIAEHSHKHYFFTYKTMVIPLISTMFIVFDNNKKEKLIKEKDVKND